MLTRLSLFDDQTKAKVWDEVSWYLMGQCVLTQGNCYHQTWMRVEQEIEAQTAFQVNFIIREAI